MLGLDRNQLIGVFGEMFRRLEGQFSVVYQPHHQVVGVGAVIYTLFVSAEIIH